MADLLTALERLRAFRSTWDADAEIDEQSGLTAADLTTILAAADWTSTPEPGDALTIDDLGSFAS
ncbi:hypothetical protein ACT009_09985 [Sphingomonas sp. Tas61C01]|uniref:hypothetical protein n=1 Tax=Sphingomonas sp. Tas61C01 TaxID=3458297 RepID=UPI00403EBB72